MLIVGFVSPLLVFNSATCFFSDSEEHRAAEADRRLSAPQSGCWQDSSGRSVTCTLTAPPALHHPTPTRERWRFSRNLNTFPLLRWHNSRVEGFVGGILNPAQLWLTLNAETNGSALHLHAEHFEKLHFQLSKEFELDHMTGLLLIYPLCVLHIVEVSSLQMNPQNPDKFLVCLCLQQSSREILLRVLEDLKNIQQQPDWYVMKILLQC